MRLEHLLGLLLIFISFQTQAQNFGQLHGDYQLDAQYYAEDSVIGTEEFPEDIGSNAYLHLVYTRENISAGVRFEAYNPALQGYDRRYEGNDITYKFVQYQNDLIQVTAGNFYDQFGSGLVFRTYQDWALGFDNSIYGFRAKLYPTDGIIITALTGQQRDFMELSEGIVRAGDITLDLNQLIDTLRYKPWSLQFGGSYVSKFQEDNDPTLRLPENVASFSLRSDFRYKGFLLGTEYAHKYNDPSLVNSLSYLDGHGLLVTSSYAEKGLGVAVTGKWIENMDFRADRNGAGFESFLNYIPPNTPQITYRLPTLYPYNTQNLGEAGLSVDLFYTIPRGSALGGKYGTNVNLNYSEVRNIDRGEVPVGDVRRWESNFLSVSDQVYYRTYSAELTRKWDKKWKSTLKYIHIEADNSVLLQTLSGNIENIISNTFIADLTYRLKSDLSIRTEAQVLITEQDYGDWVMSLWEIQYKRWFLALIDEYNIGNPSSDLRIHYPYASIGYTSGTTRITLNGGRQRAGILCVGGVCRVVPASSGVSVSIAGTF